jgi:nucleoside-diphosphate-sugar epimerase
VPALPKGIAQMTVAVTGANGKAGRAVVADLVANGYAVRAIDAAGVAGDRGDMAAVGAPLLLGDLADFGQAVDALTGVDAVVHLAAIPAPGFVTDARTLNTNNAINSNVFLACAKLGVGRVVWASSETTLGFPFGPDSRPAYLPVDEEHYPHPNSAYALSKVVGEIMAGHIATWSGIPFVSLRFSNVHDAADYAKVPMFWRDPLSRAFNLWSYVDVRDAAQVCRLALDAPISGARSYVVAAEDTLMDRPSADLAHEVFPDVPIRAPLSAFTSLLTSARARDELGYAPAHSWRENLPAT